MTDNIYLPVEARVQDVCVENPGVKTFTVDIQDRSVLDSLGILPGQFMMVSLWGLGEVPISVSSRFEPGGPIRFSIKDMGKVTHALSLCKAGDRIWVRGPYGRPFVVEDARGRDVLLVAGGIGLAPLRPVIQTLLSERGAFGRIRLLYGARSPSDLIFLKDIQTWSERADFEVELTVDEPDESWKGAVGPVTVLLGDSWLNPDQSVGLLCGPGIMIGVVADQLLDMGFRAERIVATLERHMKCGVGKCGHCYLGGRLVCMDGPVMTYSEILEIEETGRFVEQGIHHDSDRSDRRRAK